MVIRRRGATAVGSGLAAINEMTIAATGEQPRRGAWSIRFLVVATLAVQTNWRIDRRVQFFPGHDRRKEASPVTQAAR
jgi:hypothetical protein